MTPTLTSTRSLAGSHGTRMHTRGDAAAERRTGDGVALRDEGTEADE